MKRLLLITLSFIVTIGLFGCSQPVSAEVMKSDKSRITSPAVNSLDMEALVNGNSEFALDLYQALVEQDGNIFYSPYSISLALAMTYAGASGETERQMADTLHFLLSQDDLHTAFNSLDLELGKRGKGAESKDDEGFKLNVINAIWGQKGYRFLPQFLDVLAENYGAGLRLLDFINATEDSRVTINDWVSNQTEGRIEDLIEKGIISPLTRLVLTNAIYFNAVWQYPFDSDDTTDGSFHLLDNEDVTVHMIHQTEELGFTSGDDYQAVELKYSGGELSMVILLPEEDSFEQFETVFNIKMLKEIIGNLGRANVTLSMPIFEYESDFSLKYALEALGMNKAFSMDEADFSGMTGKDDLFIKDVVHKAFISVDESGTEAAASTAVIMDLRGIPGEPVEVTVDHPFIFLIRDIDTNTILFIGRVLNPLG